MWVLKSALLEIEVDYSSARNDFGGVNNAPNYANKTWVLKSALLEILTW
jgi:hypothetical protein